MSSSPPVADPSLLLVEQIQAGQDAETACRKLYRLNFRRVLAFFRRKHFPEEEALDLTQDTFFRVFRSMNDFRRESSFQRWLFEIAANVWKNELRRLGAVKRDAEEESLDDLVEDRPGLQVDRSALSGPKHDALDGLIERERLTAVRAAFAEMPDQMRLCCTLRYERGLKYREIAEVMKISIETVKAHLHQARKRLKLRLGEDPE
jgi:RNA polymerase sigma-70 factor, ECF subfamily